MFRSQLSAPVVRIPSIAPERNTRRSNACLQEGDEVSGIILEYSYNKGLFFGMLEEVNIPFYIKQELFSSEIPEYFGFSNYPKSVTTCAGKKIIGTVLGKHNNLVELTRKDRIEKAVLMLKEHVGEIVSATVESISPFGVFVDIGNGISSMVHITEMCKAKYDGIHKYFNSGDNIFAKILSFDEASNRFILSRKEAYKAITFEAGEIIICKIHERLNSDGYFVEYDPANIGIVDVPVELSLERNQVVSVVVSKHHDNGFHSKLLTVLPDNFIP